MDRIKIYGTSWCPDCARAKQVFNKLKIPFDWIDIDNDKQAAADVEKINGGLKAFRPSSSRITPCLWSPALPSWKRNCDH